MGAAQRYPSHRGSSPLLAVVAPQGDGFRKCSTHAGASRVRKLDCFVAGAPRKDVADNSHTPPRSRRAIRASFVDVKPSEIQRAWGMPDARCTRSLMCKNKKAHEVVTVGSPVSPGIPARNGFNGLLRDLPGDRAFLSPSSCGLESLSAPGWADTPPQDLTPASRRQNHTTSPSASAPFVCARCDRSRV